MLTLPGLILGLHPANERRCYFVTTSLIGWVQVYNHPDDDIDINQYLKNIEIINTLDH